jgi:hypothetical protein
MDKVLRYWPLVLLLIIIVALGYSVYYRAIITEKPRTDFIMLRDAGRAALDHTDIYEVRNRGWPFYYPPTMAALMAPFAMLPLPAAVITWYAVSFAALLWAGYRLVMLCDALTGKLVGPLTVIAFLVNLFAIATGFQRGQVTALLFALMVEAFVCYRANRPYRCGMWIALATSLKVYPALLILPLLIRRDGRALAALAVFLVVFGLLFPLVVMGPADGMSATREFASSIVVPFFADTAYADQDVFGEFNQFGPSNQSLFGVLARWLAQSSLPEHEPFALCLADLSTSAVRLVALAIAMVLLFIMTAVTLRSRDRAAWPEAVVWCLPILAANFISHVAWHHYYAVLTMPYAITAAALVLLPPGRDRLLLAAFVGLAVVGNWLHFAVYPCRQMGLLMLSSLLLWSFLACLAFRGTPDRGSEMTSPKLHGKLP